MFQILQKKDNKIIITILSLVLTILTVLGYEIEHYNAVSILPITVFAFCGVFVAFFLAIVLVFHLFNHVSVIKSNYEISRKKAFGISFTVLLILYLIWFLGVYPGIFAFDVQEQYMRYSLGMISEHHPVLHTVIVGFLLRTFIIGEDITLGICVYSIIQILLSVLVFSHAISYIASKVRNKILFIVLILYFGIYPPIVLEVLSVTKDSYFLIFFVLFATCFFEVYEDSGSNKIKVLRSILLGLSVAMMAIFRNNCIYSIPFLVLFFFILVSKRVWKCLQRATIVFIIVFILYKAFFVPFFVTKEEDRREMLSIPIQQVMRIYTSDDATMTPAQREMVEVLFDEKGRYYIPTIADIPKTYIDMDCYKANRSVLNKEYMNLIKANPKLAFEAFLATDSGMWYPGSKLTLGPDGEKGYWPMECYIPAKMEPKIPLVLDFFKGFNEMYYSNQKILFPLFFSPGSVFYLLLIVIAFAVMKKEKRFLAICLYSLIYWATFLLGPVALVRYALFLYAMVPYYLLFMVKTDEK